MTPAVLAALPAPAALGWALLAVALVWSLRASGATSPATTLGWKWWVLTAAALLCFRWPLLGVQHQLNPDESQLIAGAITLRHDPVFWRAVDGGTAGPFDYYPLLPAAWVDGFASYAVARLIALVVAFGAVVFAGEGLALLAGAALARVAALPALAAIALTTSPDFAHYSTELMPALLLAAAGYGAVRYQEESRSRGAEQSNRPEVEGTENRDAEQSSRPEVEGTENRDVERSKRATGDSTPGLLDPSTARHHEESRSRDAEQSNRPEIEGTESRDVERSERSAVDSTSGRLDPSTAQPEHQKLGKRAPSTYPLWLVALLLGSVPWAKLQAVPIAAVLWLLVAGREYHAGRARALVPLLAGALLPTLVCLGAAVVTGQTEHLIVPYVLHNFAYVGAPQFSWAEVAAGQWQNALSDGYLGFWLAGAVLCLVPLGLWYFRSAPAAARHQALAALLLLAVGVFSALAPRRASAHHLQLVPLPLLWLTGTVLALAWRGDVTPAARHRRLTLASLFLVCTLGPQLAWRAGGIDAYAAINAAGISPARRELAGLVRAYSAPGEPLAVWGWRCSLYVEAGRPQATRQAQTEGQIYAGPLQPYFLRRYFEDFQAANPPVFADAVGPGAFAFDDRNRAHECFPPLRTWVQERYTQVAELDGTRLYVRNDRLTATPPAPAAAP